MIINCFKHFRTITRHKLIVMKYCFSVGMYYQGLMHDMSKYLPQEFFVGALFYQGTRSPNNEEREQTGLSTAWLHHKGRNKHHYEYWIDYTFEKGKVLAGGYMPTRYVVEMFFDRIAACKNYQGAAYTDESPWNYYSKSPAETLIHPDSRRLLELLLRKLAKEGEEEALSYVRKVVLPQAYRYDVASLRRFRRKRKDLLPEKPTE